MTKRVYRYNPENCHYEPILFSWKRFFRRLLTFISVSFVVAFLAFLWANQRFVSVQEQYLLEVNEAYKLQWKALEVRIANASSELQNLAHQDDNNYRVILDLPALDNTQREAGTGGSLAPPFSEDVYEYDFIAEAYDRVHKLGHQVGVEEQSFEELFQTASQKKNMWASRPAIQPIRNRELNRLHTTFGSRLHPIFNVVMDHKGLDFSAPRGTPVYATGDGRISMAYYSSSYGNVVYIDHGFDFETRYAHLNRFIVRQGQFVKRGQLIGYVGNTGISASPHLHYEVLYNGNHINPINFFQRDLSNAEYERLLRSVSSERASLD